MNAPQWAARINAAWRGSVESIIETGRLLQQAKDELSRGQYCGMFSTRRRDGLIPFTVRMAQMLRVIARNPVLSNAKNSSHLPPVWTTLYQLASLPDDELQDLIDRGIIHPGMTAKDVGQIPHMMIDQVARGIEALHIFQARYGKSAEWVAFALAHSAETGPLVTTFPMTVMSRKTSTEFAVELPQYLADIIAELQRMHKEDEDQEDDDE